MMSIIITPPCGLMRLVNVCTRQGVPSGRERFGTGPRLIENGRRLEAVVARPAMPEEGDAARTFFFDPLRNGDRLATLGARILVGQIAEIESGHGASPLFASF